MENVMIDEMDIAKKVLDDVLDKENVFALLYEPDDALRKRREKDDLVIYQANPVVVNNREVFESIKDLRSMAVLYENKRENFLCKHCNIMYKGLGVEGYVDVQKVKRCRIEEDLAWWKGRRVYVGLDLAQTDDNTAVSMVTEDNDKIRAKVWGILPKDRVEINFQNARCTEDTNLNKYVNKKRSAGKVDMVMAIIDAVYLLQVDMLTNGAVSWGIQVI